jgi:dTDP-4-dehydrorhamnose 3,5-epimerase
MSRFEVIDTPFSEVKVLRRIELEDSRGVFSRIFCAAELLEAGWVSQIAQANYSLTRTAGTLRGMHYQQPPHAEMKIVTCLSGRILDVIVDIRRNSPTFLKAHSEELSSKNNKALLIPEGFAHGFQTLCENVELIYLHSTEYVGSASMCINPCDSRLAIDWPLKITEISPKDSDAPFLQEQFQGIDY